MHSIHPWTKKTRYLIRLEEFESSILVFIIIVVSNTEAEWVRRILARGVRTSSTLAEELGKLLLGVRILLKIPDLIFVPFLGNLRSDIVIVFKSVWYLVLSNYLKL